MSKDFDAFLVSEGIIRETSAPDTPQQNGLAERMQQTIWSGIRAILHQSGMKFGFWAEALSVIVHVLNCAPRKRMDWRTPYEALTGLTPNMVYFRIFGCHTWVHNNKGKKLDAKALPMTFVGYKPGSKAYRLWDPSSHKVVISSDVTFDETLFPHLPTEKPDPVNSTEPRILRPRSEGKQVQFVDIPLNVFEEGDYDPSLPKKKHILRCRASTVSSSPDTSGQAPQPASPPAPPRPPTPSSSHPLDRPSTPVQDRWRTAFEDPSDDVQDVEKDLFDFGNDELPFPPKLDNLAIVRTDLANRPTEPMLVSLKARYTKLWGNRGFLQSGSRQTTPVCVGVTCGSGISAVRVDRE